jgi:hypothetical protein
MRSSPCIPDRDRRLDPLPASRESTTELPNCRKAPPVALDCGGCRKDVAGSDPLRHIAPYPAVPRRALEPLLQPSEAAIADAVRAVVGQR